MKKRHLPSGNKKKLAYSQSNSPEGKKIDDITDWDNPTGDFQPN